MVDLTVQLGPLRLEHPVINASGTMEILELAETLGPGVLERPPVAAYVPKTVTLKPRPGNPAPRILETAGGMINAIGLPGRGLDAFVAEELPRLLELPCPLVLSIGGFSAGEYLLLAMGLRDALERLVGEGWTERAGLELNISCPNVHSGCASIGSDTREAGDLVKTIRKAWPGLLVVKLTPNVADIAAIGRVAASAGADAIAAVNTYKGLVIDRRTLRPHLGNITGGVSGPAMKPLALRAVYELFAAVDVPIIGMGGIATVEDVLEFISCGAKVVAVGSAGFREPGLARVLSHQLAAALDQRRLTPGGLLGFAHQSA
ncbi:MAG: dihydroorotate dehydrogenase [Thermoleophilia bacterium]|nr:dihydroorotate dehydrogenase [Thermoleophilia bacterium]